MFSLLVASGAFSMLMACDSQTFSPQFLPLGSPGLGSDGLSCIPFRMWVWLEPQVLAHLFKGFADFPMFVFPHWYLNICYVENRTFLHRRQLSCLIPSLRPKACGGPCVCLGVAGGTLHGTPKGMAARTQQLPC